MRLDKYVCECTGKTRSEAREAVRRGAVFVDGTVCRKADAQVSATAAVTLAGEPLAHTRFVYIMLDKPLGVVSAAEDARDKTVVDLVRAEFPRRNLFPAGRLDKASTGFVLLTDDGAFAHDILAPKHHVPKTYRVVLDTPVTAQMVHAFAQGVTLADGEAMQPAQLIPDVPCLPETDSAARQAPQIHAPAQIEAEAHSRETFAADPCAATVILTQGVYHQIKRMFGVLGAGVNALRRVAIGCVALDAALGAGGYRLLTPAEVALIAAAANREI